MNKQVFEDRLLNSLQAHKPRSPQRTKRALVASGAAAAMLVAGSVVLSGLNATPAFAIEEKSNGDVNVTVNDIRDTQALEDALRAEGVNATVEKMDSDPGTLVEGFEPGTEVSDESDVRSVAEARAGEGPVDEGSGGGDDLAGSSNDDGSATFTVSAETVESQSPVLISVYAGEGDEFSLSVSLG